MKRMTNEEKDDLRFQIRQMSPLEKGETIADRWRDSHANHYVKYATFRKYWIALKVKP